tara:strand:- start:711 stop:1181 length:471 start_codon:yes stop_codon:yes gene_type:complete
MDKLTICKKCGSDACYSQEVNESITNYQCMGCGFISNSLMKKDTDFYKEQSEMLPELYKDLLYEDEDGGIWMPSTVNIPTMGMVFANGTNKDDWYWSAVNSVPVITEEDKEKYVKKDGTPYEHRMDMENIKNYSEKDYMEALEQIGIFGGNEDGDR